MTFDLAIDFKAQASIQRNADWWAVHHSVSEATVWTDR